MVPPGSRERQLSFDCYFYFRYLENAVEELSELIESPFEPEHIASLRQKVTDKTVYVQNRNEIMLDDTAKGFLEGRWKWNVTVKGFGEDDD